GEEAGSGARRRRGAPQRQPVPAQIAPRGLVDPERSAELPKPFAELRPLALPAADADIDMVALWKDPGVTAGNDAELDDCSAGVALSRHVCVCDVALQPNPVFVSRQPQRPGRDPVGAVGADYS